MHSGSFGTWHDAREARWERIAEQRTRWDEKYEQLRQLVITLRQQASYNDGMASRYQAAQTRLRRFEETGRPPLPPKRERLKPRLSGGQQARLQVLLLELSGATLLLLDEPTDNLDPNSAEALQSALSEFTGTVVAVTHDRWFARSFDRFVLFRSDGNVSEVDEPVRDEERVRRAR